MLFNYVLKSTGLVVSQVNVTDASQGLKEMKNFCKANNLKPAFYSLVLVGSTEEIPTDEIPAEQITEEIPTAIVPGETPELDTLNPPTLSAL